MTKLFRLCTVLLLLIAVSPTCHAQFDFGGGDDSSAPAPAPWTQFNLNPSVRVKLDFRNASIDAVIQTLSQASGVAIVKDPSLTGGITLQSPKPQSLNDAFAMFNAVLDLKNSDLTKQGNFLLIKVRPQQTYGRFGGSTGGYGGTNGGGGYGGSRSQTQAQILQVYVLKYANATDLAKVINDVYATTSTGANQTNPFAGFGGAAAVTGGGGGGGGFGGRRGGGGIGGLNGDNVHASADDYSNSLVINAPQRDQDEIGQIIDQIDKPAAQPQSAEVFHLQYAFASDLLSVIQNILTNTASLGRGGTSPTTQASRNNNQGGGGFFGRFGGNNSSSNNNANGSVSADTRTNSLIVTTTDQLMQQCAEVITSLDKPATYQTSTYLYVMQNARADVVANLLNEALGNRETNGPVGGSLTTTGASQPTVTSGTSTSSTTGSSPTLGSTTGTSGTSNRSTSSTTTSVTSSNSSLETQGLDEDNRIVNIRNLSGNVLLVPNVDTNSIIVVSPPEDWPVVKSILQQMDEIPQQVMIDVLVVEASLDKSDQFGIEYSTPANHGIFSQIFGLQSSFDSATGQGLFTPSTTTGVGVPTPGTSEGLVYTLSAGQYSAFIQAAATDTKLDVLSTPRIFTTNNATAQINVSESVPYQTGTTVSDGIDQTSFDFLDVGLVLTVTPRVTASGYVTMDVSQTDNSIAAFLDNGTEPEVNQRQAQTTVSVMDGRTVCLGGIIQNSVNSTVNKVPILGDIPILGNLFKSTSKSDDKDELLVFLTPHVISNPDDAQRVKEETEAELGTEARSLIPKSPPAPKNAAEATPAGNQMPTTTTSVTVTTPGQGDVMTTPPSQLGPLQPVPPANAAPIAPAPATPTPAAPVAPATAAPAAGAPAAPAVVMPNSAAPAAATPATSN